ncbi:ABC-type glycerol-3-phosphate transport system substrate-binding protein [Paenibacillus harenae]|uniref:ABC-type glycerol-3-phosphate transport system substrate-binding protein n=2 Tax=Paenibacillus harenae TaxID=306543 RepID=A0ABT9TZN8_PAEHA|nr:ABC-type glycerol-3-phosphate transport system substrate-binding protein [Paenibacillus harenae]
MSLRRWMPLAIGGILIIALLGIPLSPGTGQTSTGKPDGDSVDQPPDGEQSVAPSIELIVNVSLTAEQFTRLGQLNRAFMMKYPHIQVKLMNQAYGNEAYSLWLEQSRQGTAADIMLLPSAWIRPFAMQGYLKPVDSLLTGDALSDQMPGLIEPLKWNGYVWGMPKDYNPYLVFWNSQLLAEAGMSAPPDNWRSFEETALKLMERKPEAKLVNLAQGDLLQLLVWLRTFDPPGSPNGDSLLKPGAAVIEQLNWLQLAQPQLSKVGAQGGGYLLSDAISRNELLAAVMPWSEYLELTESVKNRLEINREAIVSPWLNGRSFAVSARSEAEDEALLWIQEMTDSLAQQQFYDESGVLPSRASLYGLGNAYQSDQSIVPPSWWVTIMNDMTYVESAASIDTNWPIRWREWQSQWEVHIDGAPQFFAFGDYIAKSK